MGNEAGEWILYGVEDDDPYCLHTMEELIEYVEQVGFLPLFRNEIPGFSVEERTVAEYWWSDHARDPWKWRELIAASGRLAYGKFFKGKAGFISKEWFPYFANVRRDGYDFDSLWEDGKASARQKKLMNPFLADEELQIPSFELKELAGFGKGGEKNFEGTITALQMQSYLCMRDFTRKRNKKGEFYGWSVAVYSKPEVLWGYAHIAAAYKESPKESREKIIAHLKEAYPIMSEAQVRKYICQLRT